MPDLPFVRAPVLSTPFRPQFSPGQAIAQTLTLWTRHAVPFVVVTFVIHAPATIFVFARGQPTGQLGTLDVVQIVLGNVLALVTAGVLTSGALRALRGERPRVRILLAVGSRRLRRIVLASLAYGIVAFAATLALVVPGIIAAVGLYVAPAAVVAEPDLEPTRGALRRSWDLTRGRRVEVFLVVLAAWALSVAFHWVASALALAAGGAWWIGVAASEILAIVAGSVFNAAPAVVYRDLRLEKEGVSAEDLVKVFE
jgi:hypothetical protein